MTVDDSSFLSVDGLPYGCSEETICNSFDAYIIEKVMIKHTCDRRGKVSCILTLRGSSAAKTAENNMNGTTIGGDIIQVHEVCKRIGLPGSDRVSFRYPLVRSRFKNQGGDSSRSSEDNYKDQVTSQFQMFEEKLDDLQKQVGDQLRMSEEKLEDIQKKVADIREKYCNEKEKSQKLAKELTIVKTRYSQQQSKIEKIQKMFLKIRDYSDKLKNSEHELQSLVQDAHMEDAMDDCV